MTTMQPLKKNEIRPVADGSLSHYEIKTDANGVEYGYAKISYTNKKGEAKCLGLVGRGKPFAAHRDLFVNGGRGKFTLAYDVSEAGVVTQLVDFVSIVPAVDMAEAA